MSFTYQKERYILELTGGIHVIITALLLGLIVSFIGTFGGSGGLIGLPAMLIMGLPVISAISIAKFSNMISSFSTFYYLVKQKEIKWKEVLPLIPISIMGGMIGAFLSSSIPENLTHVIAIILLTAALFIQFTKKKWQKEKESRESKIRKLFPPLFGVSIYDGAFGPGQATLLMLVYLQNGYSYLRSMAFTRFQTFIGSIGAFSIYAVGGHFPFHFGVSYAVGAILGSQIAVRVAQKMQPKFAIYIINTLTVVLLIQLSYQLVRSLF
jgi:uncharacterized membrane protein YfcA